MWYTAFMPAGMMELVDMRDLVAAALVKVFAALFSAQPPKKLNMRL